MQIPRVSIWLYLRQLFFNACNKFKQKLPLLFGTFIVGCLFAIFGAMLLIPFPIAHNQVINNTILGWIFDHGTLWLILGIILLSISAIAVLGSQVEVRP